ncbi:hypothetical protein [Pseudobacillus badius]|uniref:hypothetical protein n=1 Tax=Bacillus badius TaxID=1455 RepID=UPI0024A24F2C|nr:hypothetical protein [Bacillus badius]GLY11420.1 hypothetical protein Bbad01_26360 [Bacillus badius]
MSNDLLAQWAAKDVKTTISEYFPRIGLTLEFESLDWDETQRVLKECTVRKKDGTAEFKQEEYTESLVADSLKAMVKHDKEGNEVQRQEINLRDRKTLEVLGVKTLKAAINKLFSPADMDRVAEIVKKFDGTSANEAKEIEELKNA